MHRFSYSIDCSGTGKPSLHFSHPVYCIGPMLRLCCTDRATRKRVPPRVAQRTQADPSAASQRPGGSDCPRPPEALIISAGGGRRSQHGRRQWNHRFALPGAEGICGPSCRTRPLRRQLSPIPAQHTAKLLLELGSGPTVVPELPAKHRTLSQ